MMSSTTKTQIRIAGDSDVGRKRTNNEDNYIVKLDFTAPAQKPANREETFFVAEKGILLGVADGMGGANAGEVASELTVQTLEEFFQDGNVQVPRRSGDIFGKLEGAIVSANDRIVRHAKEFPETHGMGTTCVLCWIIEGIAYLSWVGDSRAYLYRENEGLRLLSTDHTYVQTLVDNGQITYDQSFDHPDNNIITQSIGDAARLPRPDSVAVPLVKGDRLLLCSDGLNGMLRDHEIEKIITEEKFCADCCQKLIAAANEAGGHDNITVIVVDIDNTPNKLGVTPNFLVGTPMIGKNYVHIKQQKKSSKILLYLALFLVVITAAAYWKWFPRRVTETSLNQYTYNFVEGGLVGKDSTSYWVSTAKGVSKTSIETYKANKRRTLEKFKYDVNLEVPFIRGEFLKDTFYLFCLNFPDTNTIKSDSNKLQSLKDKNSPLIILKQEGENLKFIKRWPK